MTSVAKYNRLHLDLEVSMDLYDPNNDTDIVLDKDEIDTYESGNLTDPHGGIIQLLKDASDIEAVPDSFSTGIKFVLIRVMVENLAVVPTVGTITAKITTGDNVDQIISGSLIMIRGKEANITSIKLTNDEDDSTGVTLPVRIILGGI